MTRRVFSVGSEWLYYKIYTGFKSSDLVLTSIIGPLAKEFLESGRIEKWFFIRYSDPEHHLRIRFLLRDVSCASKILSSIHESLFDFIEEDIVWNVQLDTYQRELERYGDATIGLSESLFFVDSVFTIDFLNLIMTSDEDLRWLIGLRSIDSLLNCFNFGLEDKINLMNNLKSVYGEEFNMSRHLKKQLDVKFRKQRKLINDFMICSDQSNTYAWPIVLILKEKEEKLKPIALSISRHFQKDEMDLVNLLNSYVHMLMNRLFKSKNRLNEMVCYDFLFRHYTSSLARKRFGKN